MKPAAKHVAALVTTATVAAACALPATAGAAPSWETPQVVSADGRYPAVAVGPGGVAHAAWQTSNAIVYSSKSGTPWQGASVIAATPIPSGSQYGPGPLIGVDDLGNVTIAWRERAPDGSWIVKAARRTPSGATTVETIGAGAFGGNFFALDVARDGAAAIAYFSGAGQMQVAARAPGGAEFGDPEPPGLGQPHSLYTAPVVKVGSDGTIAAAYSPASPRVAVKPAGSPTWDVQNTIGPDGEYASANLAVEPDGDVVLAYIHDDGGDRDLTLRTRPAGLATDFGAEELLPGGDLIGRAWADSGAPIALAHAGDGTITVAWRQEESATQHRVYVAQRPANGTIGAPEQLGGVGAFENVRAASDAAGNTVVSWRGFDDATRVGNGFPSDNPGAVFAATRPTGGGFSPPVTFVAGGATAVAAGIADGKAAIAWSRNYPDGGCTQIEAAVFTETPASLGPPARVCNTQGEGGSASVPPGPSPTPNAATGGDTAAPRLRIDRRAQKVVKSRRIVLSFACSELCSGVVSANVQHKPRKAARKQRVVRLSVGKFRGQAGKDVSVRWKLSAGQVTAIKKMLTKKGKAVFVAKISTIDAAGNRVRVTTRIALKR